jgi:hypothetical protein
MSQGHSANLRRSKLSPASYPRVRPVLRIGYQYHNSVPVPYSSYNTKAVSHVKHVASAVHIVSHLNPKARPDSGPAMERATSSNALRQQGLARTTRVGQYVTGPDTSKAQSSKSGTVLWWSVGSGTSLMITSNSARLCVLIQISIPAVVSHGIQNFTFRIGWYQPNAQEFL